MSIDWFTFFAQIINFVVLVGLLNHFLYRPVSDAIAEREQKTSETLRLAEQQKTEAAALKSQYEELNEQMRSEKQHQMDQIHDEIEDMKRRLMQEARNEIQFRRIDWQDSLHRDQEALINLVSEKCSEQAVAISRRVLEQLVDEKLEQRTLGRFVNYLGELPDSERCRLRNEALANKLQGQIETAFEIPMPWQKKILDRLGNELGVQDLRFEVNQEIVMGINLRIGGLKTGFDVQTFIETLQHQLRRVLDK